MFENLSTGELVARMNQLDKDAAQGLNVRRTERELRWMWHELNIRAGDLAAVLVLVGDLTRMHPDGEVMSDGEAYEMENDDAVRWLGEFIGRAREARRL